MSTPRPPKPNQIDRMRRRISIDALLDRAACGKLSLNEGIALAELVRTEQRLADTTRESLTATTRALQRHRRAADAAIRELEQRATRTQPVDRTATDNPTMLRWGLNDVLWGDDDTITVLLSGPNGAPYWLELDPERAAILRQDLAGPDQAAAQSADRAALRGRIADALARHYDGQQLTDLREEQAAHHTEAADAVLAVLPVAPVATPQVAAELLRMAGEARP